jgi:hypothetical protein
MCWSLNVTHVEGLTETTQRMRRGHNLFSGMAPALLASITCLLGCAAVGAPQNIQPQGVNEISLTPQDWYIFHSDGMPDHPAANSEGAWSFDFPSLDSGHVNYVQTPFDVTVAPHNVSMTFKVESTAPYYVVLDPNDVLPATLHLFIERQGDDLVNPNGRWWAQTGSYNLGSRDNETVSINVPFASDEWSNVYGQFDPDAFSSAVENVGWIGFTLGGQYFWGHGVALRGGSAKFILIAFQVN